MKKEVGPLLTEGFEIESGQGYEAGSELLIKRIQTFIQPEFAQVGYMVESARDLHKRHPGVDKYKEWSDMSSRLGGVSGNTQIVYPMNEPDAIGKKFAMSWVASQLQLTSYHKAQWRIPAQYRRRDMSETEIINTVLPILDKENVYCYVQVGYSYYLLVRFGDFTPSTWGTSFRSKGGQNKLDVMYIEPKYLVRQLYPISKLKEHLDRIFNK